MGAVLHCGRHKETEYGMLRVREALPVCLSETAKISSAAYSVISTQKKEIIILNPYFE